MATRWTFEGIDCRRTWYIQEVHRTGLFGVDAKHLGWLKTYVEIGSKLFFDDAPYRIHFRQWEHRLRGPYELVPTPIRKGQEIILAGLHGVVAYREPKPEDGPWTDRQVKRQYGGYWHVIRQEASKFGYFPYRFSIRPAASCGYRYVRHSAECRSFCEQ